MASNGYVLRRVNGPKSVDQETVRFGDIVRSRVRRATLAIALLLILFSPRAYGQDPPVKPAAGVKSPFFGDVTVWGGQTVGSRNILSTYEGQKMFAVGVGLRRPFHKFRQTKYELGLRNFASVCAVFAKRERANISLWGRRIRGNGI